MTDQIDPKNFQQLLETYNNHEIQKCLNTVDRIVGYHLQKDSRQVFLKFHSFITTNPPPGYITRWREDEKLERWYHKHVNGMLGDTQNSLACVYYHRDHLLEIENQLFKELKSNNYMELLTNCTIGIGNTQKWDFEYQAFVLAVRRCLDYLTRAIAAYFQNDFHSFHKFPVFLKNMNNDVVSTKLIDIHNIHLENFTFVISEGNRKSTRDLISHYEYIPAGFINLSQHGLILSGGGEKLMPENPAQQILLSVKIGQHVNDLQNCVDDLIESFINAVSLNKS